MVVQSRRIEGETDLSAIVHEIVNPSEDRRDRVFINTSESLLSRLPLLLVLLVAGFYIPVSAQTMKPHLSVCDARHFECNDRIFLETAEVLDQRGRTTELCRIYLIRSRFGQGRRYVTTVFHGNFQVVVYVRKLSGRYAFG